MLVARRADRLQALADGTGGEAEPCDIGDRGGRALAARSSNVTRRCTRWSTTPASRPAVFPEVDLDRIEEVARINYLGGVWVTRAILPGLRPAKSGEPTPRQRRLDRGCRRLRPVGRLHGREARPARVLTLAAARCTGAGSTCTRSSRDRPDGGLPAARPSGPPVHASFVVHPSVSRRDRRRLGAEQRGRRALVPYRPAALLFGIAPALSRGSATGRSRGARPSGRR